MKNTRNQGGQVLIYVLIILLAGSLLIGATTKYIGTGLKTSQDVYLHDNEMYAANSGAEEAICELQHPSQNPRVPSIVGTSASYLIGSLNGQSTTITIYKRDDVTYKITSRAGNGSSSTSVVSYVVNSSGDYSGITLNVITTPVGGGGYQEQGGQAAISPPPPPPPLPNQPVTNYPAASWPTAADLTAFYADETSSATPYASANYNIDSGAHSSIGPFYRNGTLDIEQDTGTTLTLQGDVYITGDTLIGQQGGSFTLNLNGYTIYVSSMTANALQIGGKCTITGSGCIIALGGIQFMPNIASGSSNYLFIMSVQGESYIKPNGTMYGTVAGNSVFDQNAQITWTNPASVGGAGLSLPGINGQGLKVAKTWQITTN